MGKMAASYRLKMVGITDSRIRIMNELVQGIQIIKMYAWERPFAKLIDKIRKYVTMSPNNKCQTESHFNTSLCFLAPLPLAQPIEMN